MNLPEFGIRTAPHRVGEMTHGIHLSRFGASWLNAGGRRDDQDGFLVWMMNIPFKNEDGSVTYINQDDAEDAYWMMSCGKMELEHSVAQFRNEHEVDERNYVIIKELEE